MDISDALRLTGRTPDFDSPMPDHEAFAESDPQIQEAILRDPEKWAAAATAVEDEPSSEDIVVGDEPTVVIEEEFVIEEPPSQESNPFAAWGWDDDTYKQLVDAGVIRDGKLHGRFGVEDRVAYEVHSAHEARLRGIISNDLGDTRKQNEEMREKVQQQEDYRLSLLEAENFTKEIGKIDVDLKKKLRTLDVVYETPVFPDFTDSESELIRQSVDIKVTNDPNLRRKFQRMKRELPTNADQLEDLQTEMPSLYDAFVEARDQKLKEQLEFIYTATKIENQYDKIKRAAYDDAANIMYNNLQEDGLRAKTDDPVVVGLVRDALKFMENELQQAQLEGRQPNPAYFTTHPVSGHAFPKPEAFDLFVRTNKKDVLRQIHKQELTAPVQDKPEVQQTTRQEDSMFRLYDTTKKALDQMRGPGYTGLDITDDDPVYTRALEHFNKVKDNPLYWENGQLRDDAVVRYMQIEEPTLLPNAIAAATSEVLKRDMQKQLQERKAEMERVLADRQARATDTLPTIASSVAQSKPGQSLPKIAPEDYRNPTFMVRLAKQHDIPLKELFAMYRNSIMQLPEEQQSLYGI